MADRITAPFTPEQVAALNAYQSSGRFHPFTCGNDRGDAAHRAYADLRGEDYGRLIATVDGWRCPVCGYTQDWAWSEMAKGAEQPPADADEPRNRFAHWSTDLLSERLRQIARGDGDDPWAAALLTLHDALLAAADRLDALYNGEANGYAEPAVSPSAPSPVEELLKEAEALVSAATPGPWLAGRPDMATVVDGINSKWIYAGDEYVALASGAISGEWAEVMANARLIAAAPTIISRLAAALKEATERASTLRAALDSETDLRRKAYAERNVARAEVERLTQRAVAPAPTNKREAGLFNKFRVERTDGKSAPGEKHDRCRYFAVDLDHDPHALPALRAYADSCRADYPALARDLDGLAASPPEPTSAPTTTAPALLATPEGSNG